MDQQEQLDQLQIFLSYARHDGADLVSRLYQRLRASPYFAPWYDGLVRADESFDSQIQAALSGPRRKFFGG